MNKEQKLLSALSLLPVMADLLEDVEFERIMKMRVNTLINQIRSLDNHFMMGANEDVWIQQNEIQLWFRKQLNENFK